MSLRIFCAANNVADGLPQLDLLRIFFRFLSFIKIRFFYVWRTDGEEERDTREDGS